MQENNVELPQETFAVSEKKKAKTMSNAIEKLLLIEERKLQAFQQTTSTPSSQDADFHFLMSLLPYLRKVPEERKMLVRTKLQQIFSDEEQYRAHHEI